MTDASVIIAAACWIGVSGPHTTGRERISEPTDWWAGSRADSPAFAKQIKDPAVVDELDRAAAHDAQVLDRLGPLGEDLRSGSMALHFGRRRDALDRRLVERVERGMRP